MLKAKQHYNTFSEKSVDIFATFEEKYRWGRKTPSNSALPLGEQII